MICFGARAPSLDVIGGVPFTLGHAMQALLMQYVSRLHMESSDPASAPAPTVCLLALPRMCHAQSACRSCDYSPVRHLIFPEPKPGSHMTE